MKLWIDDERDPAQWRPGETWVWAKTAMDAMLILDGGLVTEISFDHDLGLEVDQDGRELNGYAVAKYVERNAYDGWISRLKWGIHSANPVGRKNIQAAMESADRYWNGNEAMAGHDEGIK